jgi:hypothetical protein
VALVITLIMLSVVTVMAITFLALSRRERASITATADLTGAKLAADAGAARAQAELVARVAAQSNLFAYDLMVSTNLVNPGGFRPNLQPGPANFTNVSYTYDNGTRLNNDDLLRNLTNLFYDPRPPVFVVTNFLTRSNEFRYYLDFNRNGWFDTNGFQPVVNRGAWSPTNLAYFVGDPEWVGILEHPDQPHSPSNLFIGRYAYIMLPAGKSLDLNFSHNSAKNLNLTQLQPVPEGYFRNQGFGSWELNLAAFFQTWLPTFYDSYLYRTNLGTPSPSLAFLEALEILRYRYGNTLASLKSVTGQFGPVGAHAFQNDRIDGYGDGTLALTNRLTENGVTDPPDDPTRRWSGSDNIQGYYSPQELFDPTKTAPSGTLSTNLTARLLLAGTNVLYSSNRFAFTRLLAQMGTDSLPTTRNKLNLNYDNVFHAATNFVSWTNGLSFFTNAADRLLRQKFKAGLANGIQIYPTNFYTPEVHRLLQLAANIGDALTNRVMLTNNLAAPSVFRPIFTNAVQGSTNIIAIIGYQEVFGTNALNDPWLEVTKVPTGQVVSNRNVYGVPWIVGVKKGLPNFNEFHLQSSAQVTRRLRAVKSGPTDRTPAYQQSWSLAISNYLGAEAWNSYTQSFPVPLSLWMTNRCAIWLRDANPQVAAQPVLRATTALFPNNSANVAANFTTTNFYLPLNHQLRFVPESTYLPNANPPLRSLTNVNAIQFDPTPGYLVPDWKLEITNRFQFALMARAADQTYRIIDFVNLDNMRASLDISGALAATNRAGGRAPPPGLAGRAGSISPQSFWLTNRVRGIPTAMTWGITNQIYVSTNDVLSDVEWRDFSPNPVSGQQVRDAIDGFRVFLGMEPLFDMQYRVKHPELATALVHLVPYTPSVKLDHPMKWQANDPLVHYHLEDLTDIRIATTNASEVQVLGAQQTQTNRTNLGLPNNRYSPWGGPPGRGGLEDPVAQNLAFKDPLVWTSDDWDFPTNKFPSIGWLGRVHRGTPWQTIYLKSAVAEARQWLLYAGGLNPRRSQLTHPTNDWQLLELFTVAPNDNAARGLLSVNQTNEAAWAAVLCGVATLTNNQANPRLKTVPTYGHWFIEPNTPQFTNIVYNINTNRLGRGGTFRFLGEVLSSPALTVASPYLNTTNLVQMQNGISDAGYERIPQQILSLLKEDEPYVVIYSYGQSLKPAERSRITAPGTYFNLCTNYQITGEVLTKTAVRLEQFQRRNDTNTYYRGIVESYNLLPTD